MKELAVFKNEQFGEVRTIDEQGKIYFCGKDVAVALGYSNPRKALGDHCRKDGVTKRDAIDKLGRKQGTSFIDEGNLYRLITHSKLPDAEKFESWVFDEVLPSIRKTGNYTVQQTEDIKRRNLEVREMKRGRVERKFSSDWLLRPQTILSERLSWQTRQILQSEQIFCLFRSWRGVHIRQKKSARN